MIWKQSLENEIQILTYKNWKVVQKGKRCSLWKGDHAVSEMRGKTLAAIQEYIKQKENKF